MLNRREFFAAIVATGISPMALPATTPEPTAVPFSRSRLAIEHYRKQQAEFMEYIRQRVAACEAAWRKELELELCIREAVSRLPKSALRPLQGADREDASP